MTKRHKAHVEGHENAERWLLTYADLITLLMVFFVVLYSMSSQSADKFQRISAALERAFNVDVLRGAANTSIVEGSSEVQVPVGQIFTEQPEQSIQAARIKTRLASVVQGKDQVPDVSVEADKEGVVVRLSGSYLFDSGRAELKPNSLAVLDAIAAELRNTPNDIRIEGHTDATPIDSPRYQSNWELSTARALAVTHYLAESDGIPAGRFMAAGLGEFHPLAPNDTREHRALNRRVEIHVLSTSSGPKPPA
jgi:chemotaxis protein MotB